MRPRRAFILTSIVSILIVILLVHHHEIVHQKGFSKYGICSKVSLFDFSSSSLGTTKPCTSEDAAKLCNLPDDAKEEIFLAPTIQDSFILAGLLGITLLLSASLFAYLVVTKKKFDYRKLLLLFLLGVFAISFVSFIESGSIYGALVKGDVHGLLRLIGTTYLSGNPCDQIFTGAA